MGVESQPKFVGSYELEKESDVFSHCFFQENLSLKPSRSGFSHFLYFISGFDYDERMAGNILWFIGWILGGIVLTPIKNILKLVFEFLPLWGFTFLGRKANELFDQGGLAKLFGIILTFFQVLAGVVHFFMHGLFSPLASTKEAYRFGAQIHTALGALLGTLRFLLNAAMLISLVGMLLVPLAVGVIAQSSLGTGVGIVEWFSSLSLIPKIEALLSGVATVLQSFIPIVTNAFLAAVTTITTLFLPAALGLKAVIDHVSANDDDPGRGILKTPEESMSKRLLSDPVDLNGSPTSNPVNATLFSSNGENNDNRKGEEESSRLVVPSTT